MPNGMHDTILPFVSFNDTDALSLRADSFSEDSPPSDNFSAAERSWAMLAWVELASSSALEIFDISAL